MGLRQVRKHADLPCLPPLKDAGGPRSTSLLDAARLFR